MIKPARKTSALATILARGVSTAHAEDLSGGEIAVILSITTQPEQREVLVDLWDAHLRDRAAASEDHLSYILALDMMDPNRVHITEVFASQDAFEANSQAPWFAAYMEEVGPLLAGEPVFAMATPHWVK